MFKKFSILTIAFISCFAFVFVTTNDNETPSNDPITEWEPVGKLDDDNKYAWEPVGYSEDGTSYAWEPVGAPPSDQA
jgi:hypothetical protein